MKKQLKLWRSDLDRYWDKTSLMGRVLLGASLAFIIAFVSLRTINNPLMRELKELKTKAPAEYVPSVEEDQEIKDCILETKDKKKSLLTWEKKLKAIIKEKKNLGKEMEVKVISAFDSLAAEKHLSLILRDDKEEKEGKKEKNNSAQKEKKEPEEPDITGEIHHRYILEGSYSNIKSFLRDAGNMPYFFEIREISIKRADFEKNTERRKTAGDLQLKFKVIILYLKDRA